MAINLKLNTIHITETKLIKLKKSYYLKRRLNQMPFANSRKLRIELSNYGDYLGRDAGCFEVKHKDGKIENYPHFQKEIGECVLKSGSYVSIDALIDLALWNIDTYIMTRRNRVVALLKNVEDDSHVQTRIAQYQTVLDEEKCVEIAKQF